MGDFPSQNKGKHKIVGQIATVRGSVVDIEFPEELPPILSLIRSGENDGIMIEAAVNIRQFERAVESLEQYKAIVDMGWTVFLRLGRPTALRPQGQGSVCLIVGSDQGMCGQFNEALWPFAQENIGALKKEGPTWSYWSIGEKIHGILEDAGATGEEHFFPVTATSSV